MANSFSTQDLMFNSPSYLQYAAQQYGGGVDPRTLTQQEQNILNDSYASGIGSNDPYLVGQRASANMQAQQPQQSTPSFTSTPIPEASANTDAQAMKLADSITANGVRNAMQATKTPDWYKQNGSWLATLGQKALASKDQGQIQNVLDQINKWTNGAFGTVLSGAKYDAFTKGLGDTINLLKAGITPNTSGSDTGSATASAQPTNKSQQQQQEQSSQNSVGTPVEGTGALVGADDPPEGIPQVQEKESLVLPDNEIFKASFTPNDLTVFDTAPKEGWEGWKDTSVQAAKEVPWKIVRRNGPIDFVTNYIAKGSPYTIDYGDGTKYQDIDRLQKLGVLPRNAFNKSFKTPQEALEYLSILYQQVAPYLNTADNVRNAINK